MNKLLERLIYTSIYEITIRRFYAIIDTGNHYLLLKVPLLKHFFKKEKLLFKWLKIYDEFAEKINPRASKSYYLLYNEIENLKVRYAVVASLISSLSERNKDIIGKELRRWNFLFNDGKPVADQIDDLERQLRGAKSNIIRKQSEFDEIARKANKERRNIVKELLELEHMTGVRLSQDNTMGELLELREIAQDIIKSKKKALKRNG